MSAHDRWAAAAGPWRLWMLAVPLVATPDGAAEVSTSLRFSARARRLATWLADGARAGPTLVVLDTSPRLGAEVAVLLAQRAVLRPVLHIGRWPYSDAVLPTRRLRAALVDLAAKLPSDFQAPSVAVVLDGERDRAIPGRSPFDRRVDNRYEVSADDLPDLAYLAAADITRVLVASSDTTERRTFATDVERRYARVGLTVETHTGA